MTIEFIGMIHHKKQTEVHPPGPEVMDFGFIRAMAEAHEVGGFDRVLVGYYGDAPDGLLFGQLIASHTKRLSPLIAHRPGFVAPPVAARKFATLDQITGGRAAIHVVSGGDDAEQARDGDFIDKEARYRRTDEYLGALKAIWAGKAPVDHSGDFYRFEGATVTTRPVQQPSLPIYFGGASDAAIEIAGKHADVYALWGETLDQTRELIDRVRAAAARHGRTIRFSISFRPVLADTEDKAWARAERIKQRILEIRGHGALGPAKGAPAAVGSQRLLDAAARGPRVDKRLWTEAALLTGARGNTTALVGTPDQVADALLDYYDLGATTFLLRGFDPLDDAIDYGRDLLPRVRELVAGREKAAALRLAAAH
ncbi:MAG TPA: LLM class flavin-dependent oxidoreductase [Kaistia sp.]|nr:LLM class flavin-dependent oxidoreductase [Kaistia sp.]